MQIYRKLIVVALASLVLASAAVASINQEISKTDYLAPLFKAEDESMKHHGEYIVALREGYDLAEHFGYIEKNLQANPSTDWNLDYLHFVNSYHVTHLTDESLDRIRRDPGVLEVVENERWSVSLLDPESSPR